ncbi:thiamine diphosphokinase [Sulfitobacter sp. HNIBRBA2951]|uniref:thiamine diphosphokinase n=1 Tax=Sulfitobacter aquimarinus TaxID=3158557 RepID=UPI0032DE6C6A
MSKALIQSSDPITLIGGGQATAADIAEVLTIAPKLVAVDGGLVTALAAGVTPQAVIGDMDSAPPEALARIPDRHQHRVSEQQTTDFDKALRSVAAPVVVGVGFCGGRLDHQLAAMHTLLAHADRPCILLTPTEAVLIAPPDLSLDMAAGDVVSLFPLVAGAGRSTGLEWPIDGLAFDPATFIGTSNRALGPVSLQIEAAGIVLIVPRRYLSPLVAHFVQGGARWPARG